MRFQNVFGVFADFLNSAVSRAKRILFDSNKIGRLVLNYSGLTTALIKKKRNPTAKQSGFKKKNNKLWKIKCGNRKEQKEY